MESRNSIQDLWGPRTPFRGRDQWPERVDYRITAEPDRWVQSACVLCSNGCALDIAVKGGRIVGVRGRAVDAVNKGRLGPKGLNGWEANNSTDRLLHPLVRTRGRLRRATWNEAMDLVVERTQQLRERYSASAIGFYTTGQLFLEEYYTLGLITKAGLGTPHADGNTRLCTATAAAALKETFGADGQAASYFDIDETDCILQVGHNTASTDTVLWMRVLDRRRGPNPPKLIVIDPRATATAKEADIHVAPRVGTNVALLNGILHLLIRDGRIDRDFLAKYTVGFDELANVVGEYPPERVAGISGVPQAQIETVARMIGEAASLVSTCLQGVYQSNQATAAAVQVNNINLVRGMIGRPGCGVLQMNGQPTGQRGARQGAGTALERGTLHDPALGTAHPCPTDLPLLRDRFDPHALDLRNEPCGVAAQPRAGSKDPRQPRAFHRCAGCIPDRNHRVCGCRPAGCIVGRKDGLFYQCRSHGSHFPQGRRAAGRIKERFRNLSRFRPPHGLSR